MSDVVYATGVKGYWMSGLMKCNTLGKDHSTSKT